MAHWLDTVCYQFDHAILHAIHSFTVATGGVFDLPMKLISLLGEEGIALILLGLLLFCFKKTRQQGVCVLGALLCGAIITNVILKNAVARPRPFADEARAFYEWWQYIGAPHAGQHSFPSGHTTSAMAAMTAVFLTTNKKRSWPCFIFALLMGVSRMYLMVHYPTDVLGGLVAGALGALGGYAITVLLFGFINRHADAAASRFFLTFDLAAQVKRLRKSRHADLQESPHTGCEISDQARERSDDNPPPPPQ